MSSSRCTFESRRLTGPFFEGKEIGRRRKVVRRSWWNKEWLARMLGVVRALETTDDRIEIGEGKRAVVMETKPLSWECPVGLDVLALSGMSDIGEEIAQYRTRDEDEGTLGTCLASSGDEIG